MQLSLSLTQYSIAWCDFRREAGGGRHQITCSKTMTSLQANSAACRVNHVQYCAKSKSCSTNRSVYERKRSLSTLEYTSLYVVRSSSATTSNHRCTSHTSHDDTINKMSFEPRKKIRCAEVRTYELSSRGSHGHRSRRLTHIPSVPVCRGA